MPKFETYDLPVQNGKPMAKAFYGKGPHTESVKIVKFLEQMEVGTSASLTSQHHSNKVRRVLTGAGKSNNPIYAIVNTMDFTTGMGIDGEYHVWRDR